MSDANKPSGEIPVNVAANPNSTVTSAEKPQTATPAKSAASKPAARKPAARKPPATKAEAPAVSDVAEESVKELHIAEKIKSLPRRRVWPD
ncbi:MAG: hypothetical protein JXR44_09090 [Thiotrichales bacterium]|nr:hypothetical protein [Thiotrichales bacterium]